MKNKKSKTMKSKKGMLLAEETLKTIIAAIAIGFLIYFLVSLYSSNQDAQNQKQAQNTLDKINEFLKSQNTNTTIRAITPRGWYIFSFVGKVKPNNCVGTNCLCICDNVWKYNYNSLWVSEEERQAEECLDNGRCLKIPHLEYFKEIEIKDSRVELTNIFINKSNSKIVVMETK